MHTANNSAVQQKPPATAKSKVATQQQLQKIRDTVRQLRDLRLEITSAEERIDEKKAELHTLERKTLPDMFTVAGIRAITIEKEGNLPAYEVEKASYYRANIAASWEEERKAKAFKWLEQNGGADLIKCEITILIPQKATKLRKTVLAALLKLKVRHTASLAVPWTSLTAFVRECYEKRKKAPPLDILGADVGEIVKLKPMKGA